MEESDIAIVLKSLLLALKDIHSSNIVHSDLKAQNLFFHCPFKQNLCDSLKLPSETLIVLADFGFATKLEED